MKRMIQVGLLLSVLAGTTWFSVAMVTQTAPAAPESLLPPNAFAAYHCDGSLPHEPAIRETASWKALHDTGLRDRFLDLLQMFASMADDELGSALRTTVDTVSKSGFSFAATVSSSEQAVSPYAVVVIPDGSKVLAGLDRSIRKAAESARMTIQTRQLNGRSISLIAPGPQDTEISWWLESGNLVVAAGMNASSQMINLQTNQSAGIVQHPLWQRLRTSDKFTVDQFGWIDFKSVMERFGDMPFPEPPGSGPMTIREFVTLFGLHNIKDLTVQSGFKGAETWSTGGLDVDGELSGVLSLLRQSPLSIDELPPMPADTSGFAAAKFDLPTGIDTILDVVNRVASRAGARAENDLAEFLQQVNIAYGGDPRKDVIAGFGDVWCVYADAASLPIPIGAAPVLAVEIADRDKILNGINKLMQVVRPKLESEGMTLRESWKDGNLYVSLGLRNLPVFPTLLVTEKWMLVSATPASAQSFVLREQGRLPSWKPSAEVAAALQELPSEFSSITVSDPAPGYRQLLMFAPMGIGLLEGQLAQHSNARLPFGVADIPPAELVTAPMFPNVTITHAGTSGWDTWSRQSVPANPIGNISGMTTAPVLIALLLPAVQQAREAARRTQSMNNLKQLAIAMHIYHDVYNRFPRGTVDTPDLPAEKRMSWVVSLLPYMEQTAMYNQIDQKKPWDDPSLAMIRNVTIPTLQNPSMPRGDAVASSMDYVGIAGIGENAADLPNSDPKAGVFGNNRVVRMRDITDGTSNTLMIGDGGTPNLSFLAGGSETVRGFSRKPYLNGPDRIGSPHNGIVQFALADGSVRAISTQIDDKVLEALATKSGGEPVGDF